MLALTSNVNNSSTTLVRLEEPGRFLRLAGPLASRYGQAKGFIKTALKVVVWIVTLSLFPRLASKIQFNYFSMQQRNLTSLKKHAENLAGAFQVIKFAKSSFISIEGHFELASQVATSIRSNYPAYKQAIETQEALAKWPSQFHLTKEQRTKLATEIAQQVREQFRLKYLLQDYQLAENDREPFLDNLVEAHAIIPPMEELTEEEQNRIALKVIKAGCPEGSLTKVLDYSLKEEVANKLAAAACKNHQLLRTPVKARAVKKLPHQEAFELAQLTIDSFIEDRRQKNLNSHTSKMLADNVAKLIEELTEKEFDLTLSQQCVLVNSLLDWDFWVSEERKKIVEVHDLLQKKLKQSKAEERKL
jgi:hypothetical protein